VCLTHAHAEELLERIHAMDPLQDDMGPTAVMDWRGRIWTKGKRSFRSAYAKEAFISIEDLAAKFGPLRRMYVEKRANHA
jgi:hypothetical protein